MKKHFLLLIFLLTITVACKKEIKTSSSNNTILNFPTNTLENNQEIVQSKYYCKVQFGNEKENSEYELRSSNALRKGTMTTTFNIVLSEDMYEKHPLDISFIKVKNATNPKLVKGKYNLRPMTLAGQDTLSYFSIGERIISEEIYQDYKGTAMLEDFQDTYVLLPKELNELNILSVKDVGNLEDDLYYKTGKQEVKGNAIVTLFRISNEQKLKFRIDFYCLHDWSISK